jgi:cytochrome c oxidase assembly protein subunit 19
MKEHKSDHFPCKDMSKAYLQCRMDKNLMAKEDDWSTLGFHEKEYTRRSNDEGEKEQAGFVAGLNVRGSKKGWLW